MTPSLIKSVYNWIKQRKLTDCVDSGLHTCGRHGPSDISASFFLAEYSPELNSAWEDFPSANSNI